MQITENLYAFIWDSMTVNNCNTYFIDGTSRVLIDPGHVHLFDHVSKGLDALGITTDEIDLVVGTHPHPDHIEGFQVFKPIKTKIAMHEQAWQLIQENQTRLKALMGTGLDEVVPDILLREGYFTVGPHEFQAISTPGHAPGSVCIYWPTQKALFSGDVIFSQGLGRTDLSGGNGEQLKESIRRLAQLDIDFLLPGHGETLAGAEAVQRNFKDVIDYWFKFI